MKILLILSTLCVVFLFVESSPVEPSLKSQVAKIASMLLEQSTEMPKIQSKSSSATDQQLKAVEFLSQFIQLNGDDLFNDKTTKLQHQYSNGIMDRRRPKLKYRVKNKVGKLIAPVVDMTFLNLMVMSLYMNEMKEKCDKLKYVPKHKMGFCKFFKIK